MIESPNYKFKQLEQSEQFQYDIVNQNFSKLDTLLKSSFDDINKALSEKMPKNGGTFTGSVEIDTTNGGGLILKDNAGRKSISLNDAGEIVFSDAIRVSGNVYGNVLYENGRALSTLYAAAGHSHAYVPTSGGTISGNLTVTGTITQGSSTLANTYAAANHSHAYLPIAGGTVTGATSFSSTITVGANATFNGEVYTADGKWLRSQGVAGWYHQTYGGGWFMQDASWIRAYGSKGVYVSNAITATGNITGAKVFNAVWNDYAEFFPRGGETEPGDIIMLDTTSKEEKYIISSRDKECIPIGVHSDTYGHIVGGDTPPDEFTDYEQYNMPKYIPVGLAGRVDVKFIGKSKRGMKVVPSKIPGVGKAYEDRVDSPELVVGILVEEDSYLNEIRRLRMKIL